MTNNMIAFYFEEFEFIKRKEKKRLPESTSDVWRDE